jgi:sulfate/thiosulfate transport system substrate-binding protein
MSTDGMSADAPAVRQHPITVSRNTSSGKTPRSRSILSVARLFLGMAAALVALDHAVAADMTILNVSYDPTREFYEAFNKAFANHWHLETGEQITIEQSHGGSGTQARAVMNGLDADVVTLGIASDIDALAKAGLIAKNWQSRLPDDSCPYTSTIVFLVRKGNPKRIRDWTDLERPDVGVVTPNPKTSSGGRWSFLAAWGWALDHWGGDESKARDFVAKIYKRAPVLEAGARGATIDFTRRGIGDVLLSWENEALLAVRENGSGQFEIVRPAESILAEPPVTVVDRTVDARGTRGAAEAYLNYLYSDVGQELAAKNYYRPRSESVSARHADEFPPLKLFTVAEKFGNWDAVQAKYFADGGVFDRIYEPS